MASVRRDVYMMLMVSIAAQQSVLKSNMYLTEINGRR